MERLSPADALAGTGGPYPLRRDSRSFRQMLCSRVGRAGGLAVCKVGLRSRERLAVLRPRHGILVLYTLHWPEEIRAPATCPARHRHRQHAVGPSTGKKGRSAT
ncbi:Ku protein [Streptomyces sp. WAC01526]|uniref:Ku protein n=1 Tax=Streptomyces sp. WAC01526 TaxID=2588709 RepID=UPI0037DD0511